MLKWPNDLLLAGKKLAGILLERSGDRVVVGFGVNLATAPAAAGSCRARHSGKITPEAFAPLLAAVSPASALVAGERKLGARPGLEERAHLRARG